MKRKTKLNEYVKHDMLPCVLFFVFCLHTTRMEVTLCRNEDCHGEGKYQVVVSFWTASFLINTNAITTLSQQMIDDRIPFTSLSVNLLLLSNPSPRQLLLENTKEIRNESSNEHNS